MKKHFADTKHLAGGMKVMHNDGDGEYVSKKLINFYRDAGVKNVMTAPNTPEQNGRAERYWRTVKEARDALLTESGLGEEFGAFGFEVFEEFGFAFGAGVVGADGFEELGGRLLAVHDVAEEEEEGVFALGLGELDALGEGVDLACDRGGFRLHLLLGLCFDGEEFVLELCGLGFLE